jgi:OmcA/MtrC family decaheme c-type cytochrome
VKYDDTTRQFTPSFSYSTNTATDIANNQITVTTTSASFAPESSNAEVYGYIVNTPLDTEALQLYADVANAGHAYGTAANYQSAANVSACETCHGKPYMKHGYRMAHIPGTNMADFGGCKNCHYDSRAGHDLNWQIESDLNLLIATTTDPTTKTNAEAELAQVLNGTYTASATGVLGNEPVKYAYIAKIMNDVHMSHNMEFPYPQTMQSCTTCHSGQMGTGPAYDANQGPQPANNDIFADDKFHASTCVSCHSVEGLKAKMTADSALSTIHSTFLSKMDDPAQRDTVNCVQCHGTGTNIGGIGPSFAQIHNNGYDTIIYATTGLNTAQKYSSVIKASVDSATYDATTHTLDITFSATGDINGVYDGAGDSYDFNSANITPTVMIGLYGYDSKDFIVGAHLNAPDGRKNLEHKWGDGNPRFTDVSAGNGQWEVKVDLSLWANMLDAANANTKPVIRRAEIAIEPSLLHPTKTFVDFTGATVPSSVALNAPSDTFDFGTNQLVGYNGYYPNLVNVAQTANSDTNNSLDGCNTCHVALGPQWGHDGYRGGNIRVCRICHEVSSGASSFELQSRSIDSFVHAIHSFQGQRVQSIDYEDPVQVAEYENQIKPYFPRFTVQDCEACHVNATDVYEAGRHAYDVPVQAKSMPGVLSGSAANYFPGHTLGDVANSVTGPAVRACGACHRAQAINANDPELLAILISHWQTFGYYIEISTDHIRDLWNAVVAIVMPGVSSTSTQSP